MIKICCFAGIRNRVFWGIKRVRYLQGLLPMLFIAGNTNFFVLLYHERSPVACFLHIEKLIGNNYFCHFIFVQFCIRIYYTAAFPDYQFFE